MPGTGQIRVRQRWSRHDRLWLVAWTGPPDSACWSDADAVLFACVLARCALGDRKIGVPVTRWRCAHDHVRGGTVVAVSSFDGAYAARSEEPLPLVRGAAGFEFDLFDHPQCWRVLIHPVWQVRTAQG